MEKIFTLEHEMLAVKNLAGLYDAIAEKLGFDILDESLRYDCRKVCISGNIQKCSMKPTKHRTRRHSSRTENKRLLKWPGCSCCTARR